MAYDEQLADRIREALKEQPMVAEQKMFQGLCFMVDDKMCICVRNGELLCRIGEEQVVVELEKDHCRQMIHNGKPMKDYVFVEDIYVKTTKGLQYWLSLCLQFNKQAKSSKKKKKGK